MTVERIRKAEAGPFTTVATGGPSPSSVWFVDKNFVPSSVGDADGSQSAPFTTWNAAAAAAQADFTANGRRQVIVLTGVDYSGELSPPALDFGLTVRCWQPFMPGDPPIPVGVAVLPPLLSSADVLLEGIFVSGGVSGALVSFKGSFTNGAVLCTQFKGYAGSQVSGVLTATEGIDIDDCILAELRPGAGFRARVRNCTQLAACLVVGDLIIDGYSNSFQTFTVDPAFQLFVAERQARETLSIVVPAVAAGNVGYVSTAFVGELAILQTNDPLVGNPTADLVAAGAGGGFVNCWVDAPGSVRCSFVGPLAGGAVNFTFATL